MKDEGKGGEHGELRYAFILDKMAKTGNFPNMPGMRESLEPARRSEADLGLQTVTASDLKNNFGEVITRAAAGAVAITRHQRAEFVLLTVAEYRELQRARSASLDALSSEFDAMVARMNTPAGKRAVAKLFKATPAALGKSAAKAARAARAR
jgi:antitoxin Phd